MSGQLLTAREVAGRLSVSSETVLRWTRRGELPAIYLSNRAVRFREDELDAWLSARATGRPTMSRTIEAAPAGAWNRQTGA
jgi:excisionase family DNA binding protein